MTHILGVSASQRAQSNSRGLLERLLGEAQTFGAETRLLDLRTRGLELMRPDSDESPANYDEIQADLHWADTIVLATPDYHGGMVGTMKNFLDHYWGEYTGKLFGFIVASHEKGLTVQDQMRTAVRQCYGWSLPYGIGFEGGRDIDFAKGTITPQLEKRTRMMARDLTIYGGLLRAQFNADLAAEPTPPTFAARSKA